MASNRRYADRTRVPEHKSRSDIEAELQKHNCQQTAVMNDMQACHFAFVKKDRMYRVTVTLPPDTSPEHKRERMRRMRTLYLYVKGRLNAVEDGLHTFEEEFMPDLVMENGQTLKETAQKQIEADYKDGRKAPARLALPGPTGG